jgi:hypothetical protein
MRLKRRISRTREDAMIRATCASLVLAAAVAVTPFAAAAQKAEKWATSWAASVQGPYPVGNPSAQPNMSFALPKPEAGASNVTGLVPSALEKRSRVFSR